MSEAILRLPEVKARTGLSRSTIYEACRRGTFPSSINLGPRAVGWIESEVALWIDQRIRETREPEREAGGI